MPPVELGSNDAWLEIQFKVFCEISTTMHGGELQMIGRESRLRTVPQLSVPSTLIRQTFAFGIVKPLYPA